MQHLRFKDIWSITVTDTDLGLWLAFLNCNFFWRMLGIFQSDDEQIIQTIQGINSVISVAFFLCSMSRNLLLLMSCRVAQILHQQHQTKWTNIFVHFVCTATLSTQSKSPTSWSTHRTRHLVCPLWLDVFTLFSSKIIMIIIKKYLCRQMIT